MFFAVHSLRLVLYGGIALFIVYISLQSNLPSSAIRRFGGLRSHPEADAGLQQLGAVGKSAHADHSFNYLENIPDFRKLPTYSDLEASFSGLSKRDVCADTFPGTVKNTCTPGNTLCCVSLTKPFPQCQVIIDSGYCCVSSGPTGGCYIDLTTSSCGMTGAVRCTELAEGTSEACCPAGTTCPSNFNQSNADIRCQIPYPSSSSISSSSTSTSSTSTTSSTTSSTASTTTSSQSTAAASPAISSAPSPNTSTTTSSTLSAGAIAGIAVGAVALILLAALIFLLLKKRKNKARNAAAAAPYTGTAYADTAAAPYGYDPYKQGEQYPRPMREMDAIEQVRPVGEMEAMSSGPHVSRHELDASTPQR